MRFLPEGADVPDELIRAARSGGATFLCGAGISHRVGLPSFRRLTEQVYEQLGETRDDEGPEREAFARKEYDRVLRSLEKRTRRPGTASSRVREATAALLAPVVTPLPDHRALLELSRDTDGRPRVLTTNFDTLFERAAKETGLVGVPSHAGKSMPKPGGPRDHGVLHLHGRIADAELELRETDLVLTSADFGDAYLRDGWASRYIEDRMRLGPIVLVGYAAEDAALRLLLETLDADRDRFPDLKPIYAIERSTVGSAAQWRAKGILPIEFTGYDEIYASLGEWSRFSARPVEYGRERLRTILGQEPADTSEFEREQLRFFLSLEDHAASLAELNPSLGWLPELASLQLIRFDEPRLATWIERNFASKEAVRDVVENIDMFGADAAEVLEFRLRQHEAALPELLAQCWRLILRQMTSKRQGLARYEWFDLAPRVKRGEHGADLMDRLAAVLRPRLTVTKRFGFGREIEEEPTRPIDLMSVSYEVDDDVVPQEVISAWPKEAEARTDAVLLDRLTVTLDHSLADAVEVGVEGGIGWGTSDFNVASVADHPQNANRGGFLVIARVMAEVWSRLATKDATLARGYLERWSTSDYRLMRRLALFAAADPIVTPDDAAAILAATPRYELFLTNSAVEVFRLLRARWQDWPEDTRAAIEERLREGPPKDVFREDADAASHVDRCLYDVLGQLEAQGFVLTVESRAILGEIAARWPNWRQRPREQAGFHSWSESSHGVIGDPAKLEGIADDRLVAEANAIDAAAPFGDGDAWSALCQTDPARALRGLQHETAQGRWTAHAWRPLLVSSRNEPARSILAPAAARLLLDWPDASFHDIAGPAASWLSDSQKALPDEFLWPLWDKVLAGSVAEPVEETQDGDWFSAALNRPAGVLAQILLRQAARPQDGVELPGGLRERFDRLILSPGVFGKVARVRIAAEVARLFEIAPAWTAATVVPWFNWNSAEAPAAWSARKYSNHLGSPDLFDLIKGPFLELFGRPEVPQHDKDVFADWLTAIAIANQREVGYRITLPEGRSALRRAGTHVLWSVGHHLAIVMEGAKAEEKLDRWRQVVGPVFRGLWPLDAELQTSAATFKLVQMLRATGPAFPEAVDVILPFVQPDQAGHHSTSFSLANADAALYQAAPERMLALLDAIVGDAPPGSVFALGKTLEILRASNPALADNRRFQRLLGLARPD